MTFQINDSIERFASGAAMAAFLVMLCGTPCAWSDPIPGGWQANNMKPIGYSGADGRGGSFKLAIRRVADRWYLYTGHEWHRGWTILDISDISKPKLIGQLNVSPPFASANPAHDVLPIPGKDLLYVHGEATGGGDEPNDTPACSRAPVISAMVDIKNPTLPTEVGWFIPPAPTKRYGPLPYDKLVNQTEDVLADTRGNIYISDKNWGVFILRYTGPGQPAPTAK